MAEHKKWKRRESILNFLKERKEVSVEELIQHFGLSPSTIRRDLYVMEKEEMVIRTFGSVQINKDFTMLIPHFEERFAANAAEKKAIAVRLCQDIPDGASVALDSSTTCYYIAQELKNRSGMQFATNSIKIATCLSSSEKNNVMLAGGNYRPRNFDCLGSQAISFFGSMRFDYVIYSPDLIVPGKGIFHINGQLTDIIIAMKNASDHILLAADHSKFEQKANFKSAGFDELDTIYLGQDTSAENVELLKACGTKTVLC
ncbi:MAG: DeoR/GlpR transcriptional regulator [Lachnospiraceae bacterium]|nr:DeoR/GlpR transcriptional regulator [Lachnospiraceae bacterium]